MDDIKISNLGGLIDEVIELLMNKEYIVVSTDSEYESSTEEESEEELESVEEEYKITVDKNGFYSIADCVVKLEVIKEVLSRNK